MLDLHDVAGEFLKALAVFLGSSAFGYARRFYRDLNALFGKLRALEARVKELEQANSFAFRPEIPPSTGNSTRS